MGRAEWGNIIDFCAAPMLPMWWHAVLHDQLQYSRH